MTFLFSRPITILPVILGLFLAACQDQKPTVSLTEAKKITAKFSGSTFTPPPRTIKDITAILDKEKRVDVKAAAEAKAKAAEEPTAGADKDDLASFYWQRGLAARKIGASKQALADMRKAEQLSRGTPGETRYVILWDLAVEETLVGNIAHSIRYREETIKNIPPNQRGQMMAKLFVLSWFYAAFGDFEKADARFNEAGQIFADSHGWGSWSRGGDIWTRNYNRAKSRILYYKGKYAEAEPFARKTIKFAKRALDNIGNKYDAQIYDFSRSFMARLLIRQGGRLVEAEIEARSALTSALRRFGRYSSETAYTLKYLAAVIGAQGRYEEAEKLSRAVLDINLKTGVPEDSYSLASTRRDLASFLVNQSRWKEALKEYDAVKKGLANDPKSLNRLFGQNLGRPLALLGAGRTEEALAAAEKALRSTEKMLGPNHSMTAQARGIVAMAAAKLGQKEKAFAAFSEAVPKLIAGAHQGGSESSNKGARDHRVGRIMESYIGLLADIRGTAIESKAKIDATAEGFRIAGVARGQSVQRALAASAARAAAKNPALADLVRRQQDTEKQSGAAIDLLANMLSTPSDQQDANTVKGLRDRLGQLRAVKVALAKEIEKGFPDYAQLMNPKPATVADAQAVLGPGEALISTYVGDDKTYVWAIPRTGKVAFAAAKLGREDLTDSVGLLRGALDPQAQTLGDIPEFDLEEGYRLYKALLAPVADGWKSSKSLLIVAHGPLGYLPMSVLPTKPVKLGPEKKPLFSNYKTIPWLARTHAVTMLPSVASLRTLRGLPPGKAKRKAFAGFGDPFFNVKQAADAAKPKPKQVAAIASRGLKTRGLPVHLRAAPKTKGVDSAELAILPRLPDTADELSSIALAMNADLTKSVFLGKKASEGLIKSMDLSGFKVLAFATHGLVPGDLNGLTQPALALSSPMVTGGKDDGLLTMGEILGLKLDADWVVLSACNTGSGQGAGAEAVSGLGRAFFYAGTRALLVSNWPVETTSAKALTTDLFRRQSEDATLSRAEALRLAMVGLIDGPGKVDPRTKATVYSYAHPLFWAPFTLIGDGGGGRPTS